MKSLTEFLKENRIDKPNKKDFQKWNEETEEIYNRISEEYKDNYYSNPPINLNYENALRFPLGHLESKTLSNYLKGREINENLYNEFFRDYKNVRRKDFENFFNTLVIERLMSFTTERVIYALEKRFSVFSPLFNFELADKNSKFSDVASFILYVEDYIEFALDNIDKLITLCQDYGYYVTKCRAYEYNKQQTLKITFEPINTKNLSKEIKEEYNNKIYHLTLDKNIESIKKYGIYVGSVNGDDIENIDYEFAIKDEETVSKNIPKTVRERINNSITYRYFTNRSFFFATNDDIQKSAKIVLSLLKKSYGMNRCKIVEIDLKKHNFPLYKDTMMPVENNILFCYTTIDIPKQLISKIIDFEY